MTRQRCQHGAPRPIMRPLVGVLLVTIGGGSIASSASETPLPFSERTTAYQQRFLEDLEKSQAQLEGGGDPPPEFWTGAIEIGQRAARLYDMAVSDLWAYARSEHTSRLCRDTVKELAESRPDFEAQIAELQKRSVGPAGPEHAHDKVAYLLSAIAFAGQTMMPMGTGAMACFGGAKAKAWMEMERKMEEEGSGFQKRQGSPQEHDAARRPREGARP